jgi:hypothetical protein
MTHIEEYKKFKTCAGWKEKDAMKNANWPVKLMFKDAKGQASLLEKVVLQIEGLLSYNNVDHILEEEIFEKAQDIINLISKAK